MNDDSIEMLDIKDFIETIKELISDGDIVFNKDNSIKELKENAMFYINEFINNCIYEPIEEAREEEKNQFLAAIKNYKLVDDRYKLSSKLYLCKPANSKTDAFVLAAKIDENKCIPVSKTFYKDILYYVSKTNHNFLINYFNDMGSNFDNQFYNNNKSKNNEFGFVYIGKQLNEKGLYKIGMTKNLSNRLSTFKCGNCFIEFIMTKYTNNPSFLEKKLHTIFKNRNFKREWYKLDDDDFELLSEFGFNYCIK